MDMGERLGVHSSKEEEMGDVAYQSLPSCGVTASKPLISTTSSCINHDDLRLIIPLPVPEP
jgi:hypothetical protein